MTSRGKLAGKTIPVDDAMGEKKKKDLRETVATAAPMVTIFNPETLGKVALPTVDRIYPVIQSIMPATTREDEAIVTVDNTSTTAALETQSDICQTLDASDDEEAGVQSTANGNPGMAGRQPTDVAISNMPRPASEILSMVWQMQQRNREMEEEIRVLKEVIWNGKINLPVRFSASPRRHIWRPFIVRLRERANGRIDFPSPLPSKELFAIYFQRFPGLHSSSLQVLPSVLSLQVMKFVDGDRRGIPSTTARRLASVDCAASIDSARRNLPPMFSPMQLGLSATPAQTSAALRPPSPTRCARFTAMNARDSFVPSLDKTTEYYVGGEVVAVVTSHPQVNILIRGTLDLTASRNWTNLFPIVAQYSIGAFCEPAGARAGEYLRCANFWIFGRPISPKSSSTGVT